MSKQKLDMMFGAFDGGSDNNNEEDEDQGGVLESSPDTKKGGDKKKKKKSKSKKRRPEDSVSDLQSKVQGAAEDTKRVRGADEDAKQEEDEDMMEDEDDRLRKEGELIEQVINTGGTGHIGYDENDYVVEVQEYNNCTHEYVAPRTFVRTEFKRPTKKAK